MARKKITMQEAIFYKLYKTRKEDAEEYTPVWALIGEIYIPEFHKWAFVSYEVAARCCELYQENPGLFDRRMTTGKSGSRYYEYRFSPSANAELILKPSLHQFYKELKRKQAQDTV